MKRVPFDRWMWRSEYAMCISAQLELTVWICSLICNQDYMLLMITLKVSLTLTKNLTSNKLHGETNEATYYGWCAANMSQWSASRVCGWRCVLSAYVTHRWTTFSHCSRVWAQSKGVLWADKRAPFSLNSNGLVWKTLSLLLPMALETLGTWFVLHCK